MREWKGGDNDRDISNVDGARFERTSIRAGDKMSSVKGRG